MKKYIRQMIFLVLILCTGCIEEPKPESLSPLVTLQKASNVTRTSAVLSGKISIQGSGKVDIACFRYGTTAQTEHMVPTDDTEGETSVLLNELSPNTLYYFRLEASNGYQTVASACDSFRTAPNTSPVLSKITELGHTPMSVLLSCKIENDGGSPIKNAGFTFRTINENNATETIAKIDSEGYFSARLSSLSPLTEYQIYAFAENETGRTYTDVFPFITDNALFCKDAGMLNQLISDEERYSYTSIRIVAPLNGTVILLLRDMAGTDAHGTASPGKLQVMELKDAKIVSGGMAYNNGHYTQNDTVSVSMFAALPALRKLQLPYSVKVIEANAFSESSNLIQLSLPDELKEVAPSVHCPALEDVFISDINPYYHTEDGLLYNKSGETLIWYPRGKQTEELALSPTLKTIDAYALEGCLVKSLIIPSSVEKIGVYAFANSQLESIIIPDKVLRIERGTFQNSSQLKEITLGKSVEYLSAYCFDGTSLTDLYLKCDLPPYATELSFAGIDNVYNTCTVHVPQSSKSWYLNHPLWGQFKRIVTF